MIHVHLIGIGGSGISSIARVLLEKGYTVSGSDRILSPLALDLMKSGVDVFEGHAAENIIGADIVVRSSAIPDDNQEVVAAQLSGIPVLKRSDFLGDLLQDYTSIAVAGSHGKTTTSAMLAWTLSELGKDPGYILGGISLNLGGNAHAGNGEFFVVEADEYDNMFLGLDPSHILLTNVEYDHPDCFPTLESYLLAFEKFIGKLQPGGTLVACADYPVTGRLIKPIPQTSKWLTYGFTKGADFQAVNLVSNTIGGSTFDILDQQGNLLVQVELQVPGEHNVLNAAGVIAIHHNLGNSLQNVASALRTFKGTGRRFEVIGEAKGITIIDDYAHHPTKVRATLLAARQRFPGRRLIAIWQPHTFSRTKTLKTDFALALKLADQVIITDVYASREKIELFNYADLVADTGNAITRHIPDFSSIQEHLMKTLLPGDVLLVLSAGDANQICFSVLDALNERKD